MYADPVFVGQEEDGSLRWKVPDSGFSHIVVVGRALSGDSSREEPVVHFLQQPEDPDFPDINTPFSVAYLPVSFIPVLLKILELSARRKGPLVEGSRQFGEGSVSPGFKAGPHDLTGLEEAVSRGIQEGVLGHYQSVSDRLVRPLTDEWDADEYRLSVNTGHTIELANWRGSLNQVYGAEKVTEEVIRQCRAR